MTVIIENEAWQLVDHWGQRVCDNQWKPRTFDTKLAARKFLAAHPTYDGYTPKYLAVEK